MKLKHLGLLALFGLLSLSCSDDKNSANGNGMGEINATFEADYGVRSSLATKEDNATTNEIEAISPDIQNFTVHLTKSDGSFDKTWPIAEFPAEQKFSTGIYSMEIFYGNINEEGFEKPYYYGTEKFEVIDEEVATPSIEAKLGNSMVSIAYTEAFQNYFSSYSTKLRTAIGNIIEFNKEETKPAYVKPGKVTFLLSMTKTNGTELSLEPAGIDNALACTHYKVTFDVNGGEVGDAVLSVTFDDATEIKPIEIPLSDELLLAPAPIITTKGFENNTVINIIEGDEVPASVAIIAQSGIAAVTLNTNSEYLISNGWPSKIDLMTATTEQQALLQQHGLSVKGLWNNPNKMAIIDFSNLIPILKPTNGNSSHSFTIQVKDIYGREAETAAILTINAPAVIFEMSKAQKSEAGSLEGTFLLTFNGNIDNVSFKALNDYGNYIEAPVKSIQKNTDGTYAVTVTIPDNAANTTVKGYYKGEEKSSINVKIGKTFTLSANDYDIWATKAMVMVNTKVADFKNTVISNVKTVLVNGSETTNYTKDATNYTFTVNGLTPGAQNVIKIIINDEDGDETSASITVNTEVAAQIPNSNMENWTVESKSISGKTYYNFLPYNTENGTEGWWATNNEIGQNGTIVLGIWWKGCFASSTSYTTDAHSGNKAAYIFTNGHGRKYASTGEILYTEGAYAGSLFVGSFNYDSSKSDGEPVHGHAFTSRPSSMIFWYKYAPKGTDSYKVWVALKNGDEVIAEGTYTPTESSTPVSSYAQASVNLNYRVTTKKATSICVQFLSTTKTSFNSSDFNKKVTINYPEVGNWVAHRGSELWIDDIVLNY